VHRQEIHNCMVNTVKESVTKVTVSLQNLCTESGDTQHTSVTPVKELNSLIYRSPRPCTSYKLLKQSGFLPTPYSIL